MPTVFIAYRREDTGGHAGRVYDRLASRWGKSRITRDVEGIPPGIKFADYVKQKIAGSDYVLVLIGKRWIEAENRERLHDPKDLHRLEIETALRAKRRVIPVLINGAPMPSAGALPPELAELPQLNAFSLDESGWDDDMRRLIRAIGRGDFPVRPAWMGLGVAGAALAAWLGATQLTDLGGGPGAGKSDSVTALTGDGPGAGKADSGAVSTGDQRTLFPAEEAGPYHTVVGTDTVTYYVRSDESVRFEGDWETRNIVRVRVPQLASVPGGPADSIVLFYRQAAPALRQAWAEVERAGLMDRVQSWDQSYVPRVMRRRTRLSDHATGLAFDINARTNVLGREPPPVGAPGSVRELVPIFEEHGFRWGGSYQGIQDGGHFAWIPRSGS